MSDAPVHPVGVGERLAGKWQIPAFIASVILLAVVALRVKSPERKIGIDTYLQNIEEFLDAGLYDSALRVAERLLAWEDLDTATRGGLHLQAARALFGRSRRLADESGATAADVVRRYEQAAECGATLTADDYRRTGECLERMGQYRLALKNHVKAAQAAPPPALSYRRRIIELSEYPLHVPAADLEELLEAFIADAQDAPEDLIWALNRRVESLTASEDWRRAGDLLESYRARFVGTKLEFEYGYLNALNLYGAARYDQAERQLRGLLNSVTPSDPVYPKAGWLLGKVVMNDGRAQRPEEAISVFRDVISSRADRLYMIASRVGMAEALTDLYRFEEALDTYRQAIADMERATGDRLINREAIRSSLTVAAERCSRDGRRAVALEFMRLAVALVSSDDVKTLTTYLTNLGDIQAAVARDKTSTATGTAGEQVDPAAAEDLLVEARALFDEAGENYVRVAWMNTLNEKRSAAAMWTAASLFDEGGNHDRAIEILRAYARDRSDAEIIPRVLLRLGRSLQAVGRYAEAIEAYQRDVSTYPRSMHANAALIPLAECFMALGAEREEEAENALKQITEDSEIFTPAAPEYRDAMFLLGDLYTRQGKYEEAIPVLDEVVQRYPNEGRIPRAMFLAANAYRQSALALKDDLLKPEFVGQSKRLRAEMTDRFREAARRFSALTERLAPHEASGLSALDRLYLQDSRLYEAACLFELQRFEEALTLYERAAWIYKNSPVALGAYVQVINCYVFLGREEDAESALRRAQYLVQTISDDEFKAAGRLESREGWKRYFDWVSETLVGD